MFGQDRIKGNININDKIINYYVITKVSSSNKFFCLILQLSWKDDSEFIKHKTSFI